MSRGKNQGRLPASSEEATSGRERGPERARRARRGKTGRVTLQDVASRAGVSTATVSRCLNNPEQVNEASRQRVEAAAAALSYVPHAAARALASRRSRLVGAVVPTAAHSIFGSFIHALEDTLCDHGYALLLAHSRFDTARELQQAEHLISRGVEGMVLVGARHSRRLYSRLSDGGIHHVNTWVYSADDSHPCIGFDNAATARGLTNYLVSLGHREFAMICGETRDNDRAARRVLGVRQALSDHGLSLPDERIIERPYEIREGRDAMHMLMQRPAPPTAVICGNDVLAFGALFECRALGIGVPDEVSITGFDDLEVASELAPPLTTVRVPAVQMGHRAARYLLAGLAGEPAPHKACLEASLVVRGTTAAPGGTSSDL